jgi:hypothetical protein
MYYLRGSLISTNKRGHSITWSRKFGKYMGKPGKHKLKLVLLAEFEN